MLIDAPSGSPSVGARRVGRAGRARSEPRRKRWTVRRSFLPSGSPIGWNARSRALYVQFLTTLLVSIVAASFAFMDGWPFLLEPPSDPEALRITTRIFSATLVFWGVLYLWTWTKPANASNGWPLLAATIAAHVITGTAVC